MFNIEFFLTNIEKQKSYAMLRLVRISWYRRLNDQSVHIYETFKGYTVGSLNADILRYNADIISATLKLWGKLDENVSWVNTFPSLSPISLHFIR